MTRKETEKVLDIIEAKEWVWGNTEGFGYDCRIYERYPDFDLELYIDCLKWSEKKDEKVCVIDWKSSKDSYMLHNEVIFDPPTKEEMALEMECNENQMKFNFSRRK